ncbi:MAG: GspH/FimT family pseudopilin [Limnohabitans sp.]
MAGRGGQTGLTLLEALVVLALVAVLTGIAAPALSGLRQQHRLQGQAEDFFNSLMLARSEALRQQQRVTVCVRSLDDRCAPSGPWNSGWLVFVDVNANAQRDSQEPLLQMHEALSAGLALEGNSPVSRYVSYGPEGRSQTMNGAFQAGTLSLCSFSSSQAWHVVVNALGKPRLEKVPAEGCN